MNKLSIIEQKIIDKAIHLKYLKFEMDNGKYTVTLNDLSGYDYLPVNQHLLRENLLFNLIIS